MMSSPPDFPPLAEMNQNKYIDDCIINLTGHLRMLVFLLFLVCNGRQAVCVCMYVCMLFGAQIHIQMNRKKIVLLWFLLCVNTTLVHFLS